MKVSKSILSKGVVPKEIFTVIAMRSDKYYEDKEYERTGNKFNWVIVNSAYYNKHFEYFEGWVELDRQLQNDNIKFSDVPTIQRQ